MEVLLKDKVAVVTGGGGGLGEGICLALAEEGARVVVSDLKLEAAERVAAGVRAAGRQALAVQTDVRSPDQCQALMDTAVEKMGALDILVCAAGEGGFTLWDGSEAPPVLENISEEQWDLTLDVNLKGVFLCNRAAAPHFRRQKSGKIINISSIGGRKGIDWIAHYSAAKAGVITLTQAVALQMAPFGVNANTVCPGVIWTPMWDRGAAVLSKTHPLLKGMPPEDLFKAVVGQMIPLGRPQTKEDIGRAVVFLASDQAKEITGQALNVDGGAMFN
ncbi:MAG: SDR family NAD(P)-dependent oxidoreductase [Thermodesulfobacteriota bacterium]